MICHPDGAATLLGDVPAGQRENRQNPCSNAFLFKNPLLQPFGLVARLLQIVTILAPRPDQLATVECDHMIFSSLDRPPLSSGLGFDQANSRRPDCNVVEIEIFRFRPRSFCRDIMENLVTFAVERLQRFSDDPFAVESERVACKLAKLQQKVTG